MDKEIKWIMECVEKAVIGKNGFITSEFIPEVNMISVKVFKYDKMAEYCEDYNYYDYEDISLELFSLLKFDCKYDAKNVEYYIPTEFDKKGYGGFDYREIIIIPKGE